MHRRALALRSLAASALARLPEIRAFAAMDLLSLYRVRTDETATVGALQSRLGFEGLSVESDGRATLWFADGGAFSGHSVVVYLDSSGEMDETHLDG